MIRKVMMDIAIPQKTGGPLATGIEECQCPEGYTGLSCELCDTGYIRGESDGSSGAAGECKPESSNPTTPQSYPDPRAYQMPQIVPIEVNIAGPKVQTVQPGETVQFDCSARPMFRTQVLKDI